MPLSMTRGLGESDPNRRMKRIFSPLSAAIHAAVDGMGDCVKKLRSGRETWDLVRRTIEEAAEKTNLPSRCQVYVTCDAVINDCMDMEHGFVYALVEAGFLAGESYRIKIQIPCQPS